MKRIVFLLASVFFLQAHPVWAEMYRYKDANGVIRYTDNLADVPVNRRAGVTVYQNEPSPAAPAATGQPSGQNAISGQNLKVPEKPQGADSAADSRQSENISNDPARIDRLLKTKTALDAENAQFVKESLVLSEEKKTLSGNDDIQAYNEKVNALNARVADYEKRRAAFQKEADAFDASVKKRLAPAPPSPQPSSP